MRSEVHYLAMLRSDNTDGRARRLVRLIWLVLPVWAALAIELIGGWRFSKDSYSLQYAIDLRGHYWTLISATLGMVIISPLLVVAAIVVAHRNRGVPAKNLVRAVFLLLAFSLLVSMFSCVWSCGGHPTWTSGYR
jgi:hypothetical protein